jgi:DNA-binding transcriptional MerR regulator
MSPKRFTTVEAAAAAGIPRATLQHWIKTGKITAPVVRLVGGRAARLWTGAQTERIRRLKGTLKPGPKKPGSRKKTDRPSNVR